MYNGKRAKSGSQKHFKRSLALVASLVLMLSIGFGATLAWLVDNTDDVENNFIPAKVPPTIVEEFDGTVKSKVQVKNDGNVSAFIRVAVVATWQDGQGNIASTVPVRGEDFEWTDGSNKWVFEDGYYYYTDAVAAGVTTDDLFTNCQLKEEITPPEGYSLSIEILAQTIQSEGIDPKGNKPIELAWGIDIENGELKAATITE